MCEVSYGGWTYALGEGGLVPSYKNIKLREETYERLQKHGKMSDSFDDLINRILDEWEDNE